MISLRSFTGNWNEPDNQRNRCLRCSLSFCRIFAGSVLLISSICFLCWDEFTFARHVALYAYIARTVVEVGCHRNASNDGRAVWVSCEASKLWNFAEDTKLGRVPLLFGNQTRQHESLTTAWVVADSTLYQWVQDAECTSEACNYFYTQQWTGSLVDSSKFECFWNKTVCKDMLGRDVDPRNTGSIPIVLDQIYYAPDYEVCIGSYGLSHTLLHGLARFDRMHESAGMNFTDPIVPDRPYAIPTGDSMFRFAKQLGQPVENGDVLTAFRKSTIQHNETVISVVALQEQHPGTDNLSALSPWVFHMLGIQSTVDWVAEGHVSLNEFIKQRYSDNLRSMGTMSFLCWLGMFVGLLLLLDGLPMIPDVVRCVPRWIGRWEGCEFVGINFEISLLVWFTVIGLAWLLAMPLTGVAMLAVSVLGWLCVTFLGRSQYTHRTVLIYVGLVAVLSLAFFVHWRQNWESQEHLNTVIHALQ